MTFVYFAIDPCASGLFSSFFVYFNPFFFLSFHLLPSQGLPATGVVPLPQRGRRRRNHSWVDGAALEDEEDGEEEAIGGGEEEMMQGDQAEQDSQLNEKTGQGMEEVFASLSSMKVEVEGLRTPQGTYHSPARTCKELWLLHPDLPNGTSSVYVLGHLLSTAVSFQDNL